MSFTNSLLDSIFSTEENNSRIIVPAIGDQIAVTNSPDIDAILTKSRLNWTVDKVKLITPNGQESGFYATQRSDTGKCFATFTDQYEIFQNSELALLVSELSNHFGFNVHTGGMFNGGQKVYIQLEQEGIKNFGLNNDKLNSFVTAINSHDGSTSLNFGSTTTTISCMNTFYAAYKGMKNKVRHTASMRDRIQLAISEIKGLQTEEKTMFEKFFSFVDVTATPEIIKNVVGKVMDVDLMKTSRELQNELSTRALNQVHDMLGSIQSEMKEKGQNLWGLFSGFTHYTTHKGSAPNRENGRLESKLFGTNAQIDTKAFKVLSEMV